MVQLLPCKVWLTHWKLRIMFILQVEFRQRINKVVCQCAIIRFSFVHRRLCLSVLEAMAYGVPVVASNRTSIPEVVGSAGIVLDPIDENEWARAIIGIINNEEEYSRYSMLAKIAQSYFLEEDSRGCSGLFKQSLK